MFKAIRFLTGSREEKMYTYKGGDLFDIYSCKSDDTPLKLADFKDIQILTAVDLGMMSLVKCTFVDGEEAIAKVDNGLLEVLIVFTHKAKTRSADASLMPNDTNAS